MAFSKELEDVIEAALADGVITEKERAVIHKKALIEGVDPDEVDVVIDGRLAKMKRQEDWLRPAPPVNIENEKRGNVVKCPNCGAPVISGTTTCKECGYVFTNVQANKSVSALFDSIQKEMNKDQTKSTRDEKINSLILNFPVPNAKEDILEFLYMGIANSKKKGNFFTLYPAIGGILIGIVLMVLFGVCIAKDADDIGGGIGITFMIAWWLPFVLGGIMWFVMKGKAKDLSENNARAAAWRAKSNQIIAKAKIVMLGDPDMVKIEAFEKQIK